MGDKQNYQVLNQILSSQYAEVNGYDFYRYIFPNNQNAGDFSGDYSQSNAIYSYWDEDPSGAADGRFRRRIMLNDTWEEDYMKFVEQNPMTLCSGLTYHGRANRLKKAHQCNALAFDLDCVGENELRTLLLRIGKPPRVKTLPMPTFLVMSGTGLHLYYVFEEPLDLYQNIKTQLQNYKYDLTDRIWDYKSTTKLKTVQHQSINQGFRMVGSINNKYNLPIRAFRTGDKVSMEYMNQYVRHEKNKVDVTKRFPKTKYTLEEAKEKFSGWHEKVIIKGDKDRKLWDISPAVYRWWTGRVDEVTGGHRYHYMMCLSVYAIKCGIPYKDLKQDMDTIFFQLQNVEHTNALTKEDKIAALKAYDREHYNFTIEKISRLSGLPIQRTKRNHRPQDFHLRIARSILEIMNEENGGALQGRPSKENKVKEYVKNNPEDNPTQIARALGISRTTVYKYINS